MPNHITCNSHTIQGNSSGFTSVESRMNTTTRLAAARTGFSLLELTLVIAIIGVLSAVAAFSFGGFAGRAKIAATKSSINTIRTALMAYEGEHSSFPPDLATLKRLKYLDELNTLKDGWNEDFGYRVPGRNGRKYDLFSKGEDKQNGTEDDISVWDSVDKEPGK
jgi:general secretion pathway protein G